MKKIININLSSRLIPIEDTAYELLKNYLDSLKLHFSREEGGDEIVSDIEDRIAEIFQEKLKKGAHCITDEDVNAMVAAMGRPDQLEEETTAEPQQKQSGSQTIPPPPPISKRLMRNENDKILGGVCSGIAAHFNLDPVIIRIITFLLILAWGTGLIVYIILWIVLPSSRTPQNAVRKSKRLYRNPDNKVVGGVASGIAAYLNLDPVVPRIIFVLPLLGIIFGSIFRNWFSFHGFFFPLSVGSLPTLILLYIILWISVPKAKTVTEKLEMRGEKVDLQSITNAMKGTQEEKKSDTGTDSPSGNTVNTTGSVPIQDNPVQNSYYPPPVIPRHNSGLGDAIVLILKIFAYFILGVIVIGICIALVGIAGGFIGTAAFSSMMFPAKGLLLSTSLQKFLAWPAIFLTLGIPVVVIIWLFIKLITGFKPKNRYVGTSLLLLWIIGVVCIVWLFVSVANDFRMNYRETSTVTIQQPPKGGLMISQKPSNVSISGWTTFSNFIEAGDDTVILKTVSLSIRKSPDDSFHVEMIRASNGYSYERARGYAKNIVLNVSQQDTVLFIPNGFSIPKGTPFRNQHVQVRVLVPIGKIIRIDNNLNGMNLRHHWNFGFSNGNWEIDDNDNQDWDYGESYLMTKDGLKDLNDLNNNNNNNDNDNNEAPDSSDTSRQKPYRYHGSSADSNESNNSASINVAAKTLFFNV
ncbi:MAG: PspC domain-containing protein [Chitinophagaceae bacterium]